MNFDYLFEKIKDNVERDSAVNLFQWLGYIIEECGEVAACEATNLGLKNKKLKETEKEELVDVIVSAIGAYIHCGGTQSHFNSYALKKIRKWENRLNSQKK